MKDYSWENRPHGSLQIIALVLASFLDGGQVLDDNGSRKTLGVPHRKRHTVGTRPKRLAC